MPQQDAITGPGPPTSSGSETNHQSPTRDDFTTPYDLLVDFKPKLHKTRRTIPVFTGIIPDRAIGRDDVSRCVGMQVPVCTKISNGEIVRGDNGRKSLIPRPLASSSKGGNVKIVLPSHIVPPLDEGCTPLSTMASDKLRSRLPVPTGNGFKSPPSGQRATVSRHKGKSRIPRYLTSNVKTSGRCFNHLVDETMKKPQLIPSVIQRDDNIKTPMTELDVKPELNNSNDEHALIGEGKIEVIPVVNLKLDPTTDKETTFDGVVECKAALEPAYNVETTSNDVARCKAVYIGSSKIGRELATQSGWNSTNVERRATAVYLGSRKANMETEVKPKVPLNETKTKLDDVNTIDARNEDDINMETHSQSVSETKGMSPIPSYPSLSVETNCHSFNPRDEETMMNDEIDKTIDEETKRLRAVLDMNTEDVENTTNTVSKYRVTGNSTLDDVNEGFINKEAISEEAMNKESMNEMSKIDQSINEEAKYIFREKIHSKEIEIRRRIRVFDEILEAMLTERSELEEVAGGFNDLNRAVDEFGEQKDDKEMFDNLCLQSQNVESKLPFLPKDKIADLFDMQIPEKDKTLQDYEPNYEMNNAIDTIIEKYKLNEFQGRPKSDNVQYSVYRAPVFGLEKSEKFRDATKYKPYLDTINELPEVNEEFGDEQTNDVVTGIDVDELREKGLSDKHGDDLINACTNKVADEIRCSNASVEMEGEASDYALDVCSLENDNDVCMVEVDDVVSEANKDYYNESNVEYLTENHYSKIIEQSDTNDSVRPFVSHRLDISSELQELRKKLLNEYSTQSYVWVKHRNDPVEITNVLKVWDKDAGDNDDTDDDCEVGDVDDLLVAIKCMKSYAYRGHTGVLSTIDQMVDRFIVGSDDVNDNVGDIDNTVNDIIADTAEDAAKWEKNSDDNVYTIGSKIVTTEFAKEIVKTEDVDIGQQDEEQIERDCVALMNALLEIVVAQEAENGSELEIKYEEDCFESNIDDSDKSLMCLRYLFSVDNETSGFGSSEDIESGMGNIAIRKTDGEVYNEEKHTECIGDNVENQINQNLLSAVDLMIDLRKVVVTGKDNMIMEKKDCALSTQEGNSRLIPRSKSENDAYIIKADVRISRSLNAFDTLNRREHIIKSHRLSLSTVRCITDRMKELQNAVRCDSPSTKSEENASDLREGDRDKTMCKSVNTKSNESVGDVSRTETDSYDSEDESEEEQEEGEMRIDVTNGFKEEHGRKLLLDQYLSDVSAYADKRRKKTLNSDKTGDDKGFVSAEKLMHECSNTRLNVYDTVYLDIKGQAVDGDGKNGNSSKQTHEILVHDVNILNRIGENRYKNKIQNGTEQGKCVKTETSDKQLNDPDISTLGPEAKCIFPPKNKLTNRKWANGIETANRCNENDQKMKRNSYQAIHQSKRYLMDKNDKHEAIDLDGLRIDGTNLAGVKSSRTNDRVMKTIGNVRRITRNDLPDINVSKRHPPAVEKTKREILDKGPNKKSGPVRRGLNIGSYSQLKHQKSLNPLRPLPSIKPRQNNSDGNDAKTYKAKDVNNMVTDSVDSLLNALPSIHPKRNKN